MSELPNSWREVQIDSVTEVISGGTPKSSVSEYYTEEHESGIAWITPADLSGYTDKLIAHGRRSITQCGYDSCSAKLMPKGAVLFSSRAPIGYVVVAANNISTNQGFKSFVPYQGVSSDFLYYYLKSIKYLAESKATGTTFKELSGKVAKTLPFPLAPLSEQKRIVEKLEEVLAQVDTIKARLDGIPDLLKRFRQSVLASAVSGKLTEEWRGDAEYIDNQYCFDWKWSKVPCSWKVKQYSELVESRLGKMLDKAKNQGSSTKYLGNINVRWFEFDLASVQKILVSDKEQQELQLVRGDVLICEGGEPGRCAVWESNSDERIVFQKALHRARVKDEITPEWLAFNLKNDADTLALKQLFTGTTIKHLTGKALKLYPIRTPSIEEQQEIVRLVDQYFAFADTIEAQVKKAQARVDNLTQSILAKAFRGELVPQDENDEPAEKLLKRIAQARAKTEALVKEAKKLEAAKKRAAKAATTK